MKQIISTIALILVILLIGCKKETIQSELIEPAISIAAIQNTNSAINCPVEQLLEIGGSNYSLYDIQQYLNNPTESTWYTPGVMNLIIANYHLDPGKVNKQLQDLYDHGQYKIAVVLWHMQLLPAHTDDTWGHLVKSDEGRLIAQHEQNLIAILDKINQIGFNEVMLRFAPQGQNDPTNWRSGWNEPLFQENWNFIYNTIRLCESELQNSAVRRNYDLGVELGGRIEGEADSYVKKLWSNYLYVFGNVRSYGFSIAHDPGRLTRLIRTLRSAGALPTEYAVDIYGNEGQAINVITNELSQVGELAKQIVIQESYYNDATAFSEFINTSRQNCLKLRCIMQWPLQRGMSQISPHFSLNFPDIYSEYGKPFLTGAGSGCNDNFCIWITGQNFDPTNSYVDVRDPNTWALLNTYSATDIVRYTDNGHWVITLKLRTQHERNLFSSNGLRVFVVNPTYPQWADGRIVHQ